MIRGFIGHDCELGHMQCEIERQCRFVEKSVESRAMSLVLWYPTMWYGGHVEEQFELRRHSIVLKQSRTPVLLTSYATHI